MRIRHLIAVVILVAGFYACSKSDDVIDSFVGFQTPSGFPTPTYHFSTNPVTKDGFELGRKLFYDQAFSQNYTISCASCHIQTGGFAHPGHSVSHGIHDLLGTRNSPPIMNLAWYKTFMWDGGIFDLDLQPVAPIVNHVELDNTTEEIVNRITNNSAYAPMFNKAFGSTEVTGVKIFQALSQFMLMCVSASSKYDSVKAGSAVFTANEDAGYQLFKQKCDACHHEPLFTIDDFRSNGLTPSNVNDLGRYNVTLNEVDKYKFHVPSLRNLRFTGPYMHDGRFLDLTGVLNHYRNGIDANGRPDPTLSSGISMSDDEVSKILSFLETLNDRKFVTDPRFSAP